MSLVGDTSLIGTSLLLGRYRKIGGNVLAYFRVLTPSFAYGDFLQVQYTLGMKYLLPVGVDILYHTLGCPPRHRGALSFMMKLPFRPLCCFP